MGFISESTPQEYCLELKITVQTESLGTVHNVYFPVANRMPATSQGLLVSKVVASLAPVRQT